MQQIVGPYLLSRLQIGRRRRAKVGSLDLYRLREVGIVFEVDDRGHHFRDAGDRPLVLGVLLEQDLAGLRVQHDRGRGPDVGNDRTRGVRRELRRQRLAKRAKPGGGARARQSRTAGAGCARRVPLRRCAADRLLFCSGALGSRARRRSRRRLGDGRESRAGDAQAEQRREQATGPKSPPRAHSGSANVPFLNNYAWSEMRDRNAE